MRGTWKAPSILPSMVVVLYAIGCTGPGSGRPTCPESRDVRCLTNMVCSHDNQRDCDVCTCEAPVGEHTRTPMHQGTPQESPDPIR